MNDSASSERLPSVAVVIATRNRPELLRKAIAAIVAQDYDGDIEVMVVFDHVDIDRAIVSDAAGRRVRVMNNDHAQGLPGARNAGIAATQSDLVAFCDDDDEWLAGKLRRQVAHLQRHADVGLVTTGIRVDFDGESHDRPSPVETLTVERLVHDRTTEAHPSSFLLQRSLLDRMGSVDESIPGGYSEDYDFLLRAARVSTVACLADPLVLVRWHRSSYFAERWATIVDAQRYMLNKHPEFRDFRRAEARMRGQIAFALAAQGHRREALKEIAAVFRRFPLEQRWPVALVVASGAVSAETALRWAHRAGKGI